MAFGSLARLSDIYMKRYIAPAISSVGIKSRRDEKSKKLALLLLQLGYIWCPNSNKTKKKAGSLVVVLVTSAFFGGGNAEELGIQVSSYIFFENLVASSS